jgi:hypothetical protein
MGNGTRMSRPLPDAQYQAAINADNPSASNPFLTGEASGVVGVIQGSTGNSNTVANTNAETNITSNNFDFVLGPNALITGDRIRITAYARYSTGNAIRNIQFRFKLNGLTIIATKAIQLPVNQTNKGVWIDAQIAVRTDGPTGTIISGFNVAIGDASSAIAALGDITPSVTTKAIDTSITNTFNFSVQWSGGAPSPTNNITFEEIVYEKLRV